MFNYKDKNKNKTERIVVRLSEDEKKYLQEYCKEKGTTVSKYIYNLICVDLTMFKK